MEYKEINIEEIEKYYNIYDNGLIVRKDGSMPPKHINHYGYYVIYMKEFRRYFLVHRIICTKFNNIENSFMYVVNHKDENKTNNRADNLEFITIEENVIYSKKHNKNKARKHALSDDVVISIYIDICSGMSYSKIEEKYNISKSTLSNIRRKKTHKNILEDFQDIETKTSRSSVSEYIKQRVINDIYSGIKPSIIAEKYGVDTRYVVDIKHKHNITDCKMFLGGEKITEKDVVDISEKYKLGKTVEELSVEYCLCKKSIRNILYGKTWKYVDREIFDNAV